MRENSKDVTYVFGMTKVRLSFWSGFYIAIAIIGFLQAWLGLERFVELLKERWIQLPWWVWLFLIILNLFLTLLSWSDYKIPWKKPSVKSHRKDAKMPWFGTGFWD